MSSLARRRETNVLFGTKRWWVTGCWATRGHQEAYLRKLYGKKNTESNFNTVLDINKMTPWSLPTQIYDQSVNTDNYLGNFLQNKRVDCRPELPSPSSTEKCVEFLTGARACGDFSEIIEQNDGEHDRIRSRGRSGCIKVTEHNLDSILQSNYRDE